MIKDNFNCNKCRWPPGLSVALSSTSEIKQRELKLLIVMHMNTLNSNFKNSHIYIYCSTAVSKMSIFKNRSPIYSVINSVLFFIILP